MPSYLSSAGAVSVWGGMRCTRPGPTEIHLPLLPPYPPPSHSLTGSAVWHALTRWTTAKSSTWTPNQALCHKNSESGFIITDLTGASHTVCVCEDPSTCPRIWQMTMRQLPPSIHFWECNNKPCPPHSLPVDWFRKNSLIWNYDITRSTHPQGATHSE